MGLRLRNDRPLLLRLRWDARSLGAPVGVEPSQIGIELKIVSRSVSPTHRGRDSYRSDGQARSWSVDENYIQVNRQIIQKIHCDR
jgi:hypothetical protein